MRLYAVEIINMGNDKLYMNAFILCSCDAAYFDRGSVTNVTK